MEGDPDDRTRRQRESAPVPDENGRRRKAGQNDDARILVGIGDGREDEGKTRQVLPPGRPADVEMDRLLAKSHKEGMSSLTRSERTFLRKASSGE